MKGLKVMKPKSKTEREAIAGIFVIYGFDYLILNTFHGDRELFTKYR